MARRGPGDLDRLVRFEDAVLYRAAFCHHHAANVGRNEILDDVVGIAVDLIVLVDARFPLPCSSWATPAAMLAVTVASPVMPLTATLYVLPVAYRLTIATSVPGLE